jgi:flavodoxin
MIKPVVKSMKTAILYYSRTDNTKEAAETIKTKMEKNS